MNKREYRNGLICAIIGSALTMIGDFFIGANPSVDVPTGVAIIDLYGDCLRNSDLRMMTGGMLGVVGMPLTGIGYYRIYEAFIRKEGGILAFLYKLAALACVGLGGAGVHMSCAIIPLLYKWIAPTGSSLATQVAERYSDYILIPLMIVFGILLFIALMYQIYVFAKGKTPYPRRAFIFNMAFGVIVPYLMAFLIGHNVIGNGIGTAAISIGHLWMFGGLLATMHRSDKGS